MTLRKQILIMTVLFLLLITPFCNVANATNYERVFKLVDQPNGSVRYSLTVSLTSSLYNYYVGKNHDLYSSADFAKFITPYSVKPIADALWNVYSDDEVFADAVLGMAQQIPYEISAEVYPVETLKLNYGDCGSLSLLVASVLKAGGLDVVLLEYPSKHHLNVGVSLSHNPAYVRRNMYWVDYNSKRYYIAESTGGDFPKGWHVGECPEGLNQTTINVVTIENYEQHAPGQVLASYKTLSSSQISISVSSSFAMENGVITIAGAVSPSNAENVSIYVSSVGGVWQPLATVAVGEDGRYLYQWRPQSGGIYYLEASWSGNEDYAGADSPAVTLYVIPFYGLIAGVLGLLLLVLMLVFWLMNRRGAAPPLPPPTEEKTEPPSSPSPTPEETQQPPEEAQPQQSQPPEETTQTQETPPTVEETSTPATEASSPPPSPTEETSQTPPPQTTPEPQQTENPNQPEPPPAEEQRQPEQTAQEQTADKPTENPT